MRDLLVRIADGVRLVVSTVLLAAILAGVPAVGGWALAHLLTDGPAPAPVAQVTP